jgi:membrane fusion protein (multidrug efflux system)
MDKIKQLFRDRVGQSSNNKILRWVIVSVALLILLLGFWYLFFALPYESTDDAFITGHIISESSRVDGHVTKVHIRDNQWVNSGDLLVELDGRDFQARLDMELAAVAASEATVEESRAQINVVAADAKRTQKDMERYQTLISSGGITQQQLDHTAAEAQAASARLEAANKQVGVANARLAEARAQAEQGKLNLSYTKIYAPQSGRIVNKSVEEGEYIRVGQALMTIVPTEVWVTANFKETQLKYMQPGQEVKIRVDAYPQKVFKGHVDSIQAGTGAVFSLLPPENATGNYIKVVQRVPVKIVFDEDLNETKMLSPGMSVIPVVKVK